MTAFHRFRLTLLTAVSLCLLPAFRAEAQQVAVKTNLLSWTLATPDLGVEMISGEHTSLALSVFGHSYEKGILCPKEQGSKLVVVQPEFRYWFNGRPLTREYVGISAFWASYDTHAPFHGQDRVQYYDGDALALGLSGGYVFTLGKRWGLELSGGTGLVLFRQKHFWEGDNYNAYFDGRVSEPNSWGYMIFPVKLAVSLIYIIK